MRPAWSVVAHSVIGVALLVMSALAVAAGPAQAPFWQGDWAAASTHLLTTIIVIAPVAAAASAWEAGRARRSGFAPLAASMPRSPLAHMSIVTVATALAALVAFGVSAAVVAGSSQTRV